MGIKCGRTESGPHGLHTHTPPQTIGPKRNRLLPNAEPRGPAQVEEKDPEGMSNINQEQGSGRGGLAAVNKIGQRKN